MCRWLCASHEEAIEQVKVQFVVIQRTKDETILQELKRSSDNISASNLASAQGDARTTTEEHFVRICCSSVRDKATCEHLRVFYVFVSPILTTSCVLIVSNLGSVFHVAAPPAASASPCVAAVWGLTLTLFGV